MPSPEEHNRELGVIEKENWHKKEAVAGFRIKKPNWVGVKCSSNARRSRRGRGGARGEFLSETNGVVGNGSVA
ncbi:hypothetical protein ACFX2F_002422 [Malus domestica]